jgi:hypothetical protein
MIADVKGPVNKILGVRHSSYAKFMKLYKVHELGFLTGGATSIPSGLKW